jgi:hypothetical protein
MFLSFNFQCRRMSSQVDTPTNSTDLATDGTNAELESKGCEYVCATVKSTPSVTWYGEGVLDITENLTAPQWQLPLSSTGISTTRGVFSSAIAATVLLRHSRAVDHDRCYMVRVLGQFRMSVQRLERFAVSCIRIYAN